MLRVGLTGGIACGKSHVLRRLASHGFETLDLDALGRELTQVGGRALAEIAEAFGPGVLAGDGSLDRRALAARTFGNPEQRERLNAILHPKLRAAEARWAASFEGQPNVVLVSDGALLVEAGVHLRFDRLLVVDCAPDQQVRRLRERDALDEGAARARIEAQMPLAEKRSFAHYVIDSSGSHQDTDRAADRAARELRALAAGPIARAHPALRQALGAALHGPRLGPRGLAVASVMASIIERGGPELAALAALLSPPARGPWYRAAEAADPKGPAATLALPLVAWVIGRGSSDAQRLVAAAQSLARLTHTAPGALADGCLYALVLQERLSGEGRTAELGTSVARCAPLAARWGGSPPSGALDAVWAAVGRFPADPGAAAAECARLGGEPSLAGAIVGAAVGAASGAEPGWAEGLRRLGWEP